MLTRTVRGLRVVVLVVALGPVVEGFLAVSGTTAYGQVVNETQKVSASDGAPLDQFGKSAAVFDDVLVIGAPHDDDQGDSSGSVYVYRWDGPTWVEEQKLGGWGVDEDDRFGWSVGVSEDVALIGAPFSRGRFAESGAVYTFRFNGDQWIPNQKLVAGSQSGAQFGHSVSVSGDVAVIGARHDAAFYLSGSAYVFRLSGGLWVEEQRLVSSDGETGDFFGHIVCVSGDVAVIGAYGDDDDGHESGSAYVFRYDGDSWLEEQKLTASDAAAFDHFGVSVAVSGDLVVVGASGDDDGGFDSGSAYVFRYDGESWVEEQKLTASDTALGDEFGNSVSVFGDIAVVGAWRSDVAGSQSGSAYVFRYDGDSWVEDHRLVASDAEAGDSLGQFVFLSEDVAVIGAYGDNDKGEFSGSAYLFNECQDGDGDGVCDSQDGCPGFDDGVDTDGDGVADGCDVCCNTPEGVAVDAVGRPIGDMDGDCDNDLHDYAMYSRGFTGTLAGPVDCP